MRTRFVMNGDVSSEIHTPRRSRWDWRLGSSRLWMAPIVSGLMLVTGAAQGIAVEPARAADELLRLVPADATVVMTLEGLRDQVRALTGSRLVSDLRRLPAVRAWLQSEKHRHFERSCADIEAFLGVKLAELRDDLFGDAMVLVLRLDPDAPPDPRRRGACSCSGPAIVLCWSD